MCENAKIIGIFKAYHVQEGKYNKKEEKKWKE